MPTVVMAAGVRALLPGDPDGLLPIVLAHTLFNLAIIVRGIAAAPLPTELERAATVLGARPTELFRTITLPLLRPTLLGLSAVVFALCLPVSALSGYSGLRLRQRSRSRYGEKRSSSGARSGRSSSFDSTRHPRPRLAVWLNVRRQQAPHRHGHRQPISRKSAFVVTASCALVTAPLLALIYGSFTVNGKVSASGWSNLLDTSIRPGLRLGIDPAQAIVTSLTTASIAMAFAVALAACHRLNSSVTTTRSSD